MATPPLSERLLVCDTRTWSRCAASELTTKGFTVDLATDSVVIAHRVEQWGVYLTRGVLESGRLSIRDSADYDPEVITITPGYFGRRWNPGKYDLTAVAEASSTSHKALSCGCSTPSRDADGSTDEGSH